MPEPFRVWRSDFVYLRLEDSRKLDIGSFLKGNIAFSETTDLHAWPALTGQVQTLSLSELRAIWSLPKEPSVSTQEISERFSIPEDRLEQLALGGILVSDLPGAPYCRLRQYEERLRGNRWHPLAALYHIFSAKEETPGSGPQDKSSQSSPNRLSSLEQAATESQTYFADLIARRGLPPNPFAERTDALARESLPLPEARHDHPLFAVLAARRTTRVFDQGRPITRQQLARILYYTFGCHGLGRLAPEAAIVKKTSPSGGALHPIEAYLLVRHVDEVSPGIYHYNVEHHRLDLLKRSDPEEISHLAVRTGGNQGYFETAPLFIILTARFYRNFWKYGPSSRTYGVLLMDCAHLSQTFYLICSALGLGAVFSGAHDAKSIEEILGLEPADEGPLGVLGCGHPEDRINSLEFFPEPYSPPR